MYFLLTAFLKGFTLEKNSRRNHKLLADLVHIVGFNGRIIPYNGMYGGDSEDGFAVQLLDTITDNLKSDIYYNLVAVSEYYDQEYFTYLDTTVNEIQFIANPRVNKDLEDVLVKLQVTDREPQANAWTLLNGKYYSTLCVLWDNSEDSTMTEREYTEHESFMQLQGV